MRMVLRNLRFYWRTHVGVLLGCVLAAAVLTGSLLVGDSVKASLHRQALQRLGDVECALYTPSRFFAASLGARVGARPALVLDGMALSENGAQVNRVQVLGGVLEAVPAGEVWLNEKLATALGVAEGEAVSLRIEKPGLLPREAPLAAQKERPTVRGRFTVARILGADELGNFSLRANQVLPNNAFVNRAWLEGRIERAGKANVLLAEADCALGDAWTLADFGLRLREAGDVVQLESDGIYLTPEAERAALSVAGAEGSLTYLVNSISKGEKSTPYSFVTAGAVETGSLMLDAGAVAVNEWLARELEVAVGDEVEVAYFELLPSNTFVARKRSLRVEKVLPMASLAVERALAPPFPGLSDVDRCAEWDAGFPMEEDALEDEANEAYWEAYRQTPKAVVSLAAGQAMWANRFGQLTAVRWSGRSVAEVKQALRAAFDPAVDGFVFRPVRAQALLAVEQAMDFGQLFVGMSFFLIVAALILTGLLFVFGAQQRADEMGVLLALGWRPGQVRKMLFAEGALVALPGVLLGAGLGVGYTQFLIWGLAHYWPGAVANASIAYAGSPGTVAVGAVASLFCALLAMGLSLRKLAQQPARELLMADFSVIEEESGGGRGAKAGPFCVAGLVLAALGVVSYALLGKVESITMPFFGAGALLLLAGVWGCGIVLRRIRFSFGVFGLAWRNVARRPGRSLSVIGLLASGCFMVFAVGAMKEDVTAHAAERRSGTGGFAFYGESTLPIQNGLGGAGEDGAYSSQSPAIQEGAWDGVRLRLHEGDDASCLNLNRAQEPRLLGVAGAEMSARGAFVQDEDVWALLELEWPEGMVPGLVGDADTAMWGLEASVGPEKGDVLEYVDEAGRALKVKLVGMLPMRLSVFQGAVLIPEAAFVEHFPSEGYRVFLLEGPEAGGGVAGGLMLEAGAAGRGRRDAGGTKEQGLLEAGDTDVRGRRAAGGTGKRGLLEAGDTDVRGLLEAGDTVVRGRLRYEALVKKYERAGLEVNPAVERLLEFYAVESTYLAMFLVLGVLALMVGSLGMGVVVLRNVQDRRSEWALLKAVGYPRGALRSVLWLEHGVLLGMGLLVGGVSAAVSMVPAVALSGSRLAVGPLVGLFFAVGLCAVVALSMAVAVALRGDALRGLRSE